MCAGSAFDVKEDRQRKTLTGRRSGVSPGRCLLSFVSPSPSPHVFLPSVPARAFAVFGLVLVHRLHGRFKKERIEGGPGERIGGGGHVCCARRGGHHAETDGEKGDAAQAEDIDEEVE